MITKEHEFYINLNPDIPGKKYAFFKLSLLEKAFIVDKAFSYKNYLDANPIVFSKDDRIMMYKKMIDFINNYKLDDGQIGLCWTYRYCVNGKLFEKYNIFGYFSYPSHSTINIAYLNFYNNSWIIGSMIYHLPEICQFVKEQIYWWPHRNPKRIEALEKAISDIENNLFDENICK